MGLRHLLATPPCGGSSEQQGGEGKAEEDQGLAGGFAYPSWSGNASGSPCKS